MKEIILLVGPPGSGKSTHYTTNFPNHYYVSQDLQGKKHLNLFNIAIEAGLSIVVDRMNFNVMQRERYLEPARKAGYKTKIIVLHVPSKVCMIRCINRENHPTIKDSNDARRAIDLFFRKYERVENSEADEVIRLGWDDAKETAIICDLDGTLCNIDHRMGFLNSKVADSVNAQKKDWKNFFADIPNDVPNKWCVEILERMEDRHRIIFCSGRPDDHRQATNDWLVKNQINGYSLFMRRRGDFRKDATIKEIIYEFELKPKYDILFWIDDRKVVVDKIRSHGVTVLACHEGNY